MKRVFTFFCLMSWLCLTSANAQEHTYKVTLTEAGTLQDKLLDVVEERVENLTIKGPLNSVDLIFLNEAKGLVSSITHLDMSEATLEPDEGAYAVHSVGPPAGMGTTYVYNYCLSNDIRDERKSSNPSTITFYLYRNDLSGLFKTNANLVSVVWPKSVHSVGERAFSDCTSLKEVNLHDGITSLGNYSFAYCSSLSGLSIPSSVKRIDASAFYSSGLGGKLNLPDVEAVGEGAFSHTSITEFSAGQSLKSIGAGAFSECKSLTKAVFASNIDSIPHRTFEGCEKLAEVLIPGSVKYVGGEAFERCDALTGLSFLDSVEEIGDRAFYYCPLLSDYPYEKGIRYIGRVAYEADYEGYDFSTLNIKEGTVSLAEELMSNVYPGPSEVNLPSSLRIIGKNSLRNGTFTSLTLPEGLERIADGAFTYCSSLSSLTIPESVKSIGSGVTYGCDALWKIEFNAIDAECDPYMISSQSNIMRITLGPNLLRIPSGLFTNNPNIKEVVIPETVEIIDDEAFSYCKALKSITIGDNVRHIGDNAFSNSAIADFHWPLRLESIGSQAFRQTAITKVSLPEGFRDLGELAFYVCDSVGTYYLPSTLENVNLTVDNIALGKKTTKVVCALPTPPAWYVQPYYKVENGGNFTIQVPAEAVEAYKADALWGKYADFITAIGEIKPMTIAAKTDFSQLVDEETDLSGTSIGNVYVSLGDNDNFDKADGSIVLNSPMAASEAAAIAGLDPGKTDLFNRFNGFVLEAADGTGTLSIDCKTTGGMSVGVMVGNDAPTFHVNDQRGIISIDYDVEQPTFIYVFACNDDSPAATKSLSAASAAAEANLKVYSFEVSNIESGINGISADDADGKTIEGYYSVSGVKLSEPPTEGIYIVKFTDGSSAKVLK